MSRSPNFFVIGVAKAGTSSLFHYLSQHPKIFTSYVKEPHFLCDEEKYQQGTKWYLDKYFSGSEGYPARGEATPHYIQLVDVVPPRLRKMVEEQSVRLIVILRDPVERAWSHYLFRRSHMAVEHESFRVLFEKEVERWNREPESRGHYYYPGLYGYQIEKWLEHFPRQKFLFIKFDDFVFKTKAIVHSVFKFIGVDEDVKIDISNKKNETGKPRFRWLRRAVREIPNLRQIVKYFVPLHLQHPLRRRLNKFFAVPYEQEKPQIKEYDAEIIKSYYDDDIERAEQLTGLDLSGWK